MSNGSQTGETTARSLRPLHESQAAANRAQADELRLAVEEKIYTGWQTARWRKVSKQDLKRENWRSGKAASSEAVKTPEAAASNSQTRDSQDAANDIQADDSNLAVEEEIYTGWQTASWRSISTEDLKRENWRPEKAASSEAVKTSQAAASNSQSREAAVPSDKSPAPVTEKKETESQPWKRAPLEPIAIGQRTVDNSPRFSSPSLSPSPGPLPFEQGQENSSCSEAGTDRGAVVSNSQPSEPANLIQVQPRREPNSVRWGWPRESTKLAATNWRNTDPVSLSPTPSSTEDIPFEIHHLLLPPLQTILEEACHTYMGKHLPDILQKKAWKCAHAAELTAYTRKLTSVGIGIPVSPLNIIRHIAVHRIPVTKDRLNELFDLAMDSLLFLDPDAKHKVSTLKAAAKEQFEQHEQKTAQERMRAKFEALKTKHREIEAEMETVAKLLEKECGNSPQRKSELQRRSEETVASILDEETGVRLNS